MNPTNVTSKCFQTIVFEWYRQFLQRLWRPRGWQRNRKTERAGKTDAVKSIILYDRRSQLPCFKQYYGKLRWPKFLQYWFLVFLQNRIGKRGQKHYSNVSSPVKSFLDHIITTDKMWINFYDPETLHEPVMWKRLCCNRKKRELSHQRK